MDKAFLNDKLIVKIAWNFTSKFENGESIMIDTEAMANAMASVIGKPVRSADGTIVGKCIDFLRVYKNIPHFIVAVEIDNKYKDFILKDHKDLSIGRGPDERKEDKAE